MRNWKKQLKISQVNTVIIFMILAGKVSPSSKNIAALFETWVEYSTYRYVTESMEELEKYNEKIRVFEKLTCMVAHQRLASAWGMILPSFDEGNGQVFQISHPSHPSDFISLWWLWLLYFWCIWNWRNWSVFRRWRNACWSIDIWVIP